MASNSTISLTTQNGMAINALLGVDGRCSSGNCRHMKHRQANESKPSELFRLVPA